MSTPAPPPPAAVPPPSYGPPPPPPPQHGPPQGPQDPSQSRSINGFAIATLVCGIAAPCGLGLLSVVFGIIALVQIRRSGDRGRKMAIGGLVATGVWVLILLIAATVAIIAAINSDDTDGRSDVSIEQERGATIDEDQDEGGAVDDEQDGTEGDPGASQPPDGDDAGESDDRAQASPRLVVVDDLQAGDCVEEQLGEGRTRAVWVVPCEAPHRAEVFHKFDLDDGPYPEDTVTEEAEYGCVYFLLGAVPSVRDDHGLDLFFLFPTSQTWAVGDREVICLTHYLDGPRTGSLMDNAAESV